MVSRTQYHARRSIKTDATWRLTLVGFTDDVALVIGRKLLEEIPTAAFLTSMKKISRSMDSVTLELEQGKTETLYTIKISIKSTKN